MKTNITFEQLLTFTTTVEQNGVNAAADALFKSPSTVSHNLKKLQENLGIDLFQPDGRQLKLTPKGAILLKQAKQLLEDKQSFIQAADFLNENLRSTVNIAFDNVLPFSILAEAMTNFSKQYPLCEIKLHEGVLTGVEEQLLQGKADIAINYRLTQGFLGEKLLDVSFIPVAVKTHPLANEQSINSKELSNHRQVVISDSGIQKQIDSGWLKAKQRWSVSTAQTAKEIIKSGMAFGWLPKHLIKKELKNGTLVPLNLGFGQKKEAMLYLIIADDRCEINQAMAKEVLKVVQK